MSLARQIVLAARPRGKPKVTDFRLEEAPIPAPGSGQILLRVQYLSLDPYMRGRMEDRESYAAPTPLGDVMPGESVATVAASLAVFLASDESRWLTGEQLIASGGIR